MFLLQLLIVTLHSLNNNRKQLQILAMLSKQQLLSLVLVVGLLSLHLPSPSEARRTALSQQRASRSTADDGLTTECIILIVNALITSINNFIIDLGLGATLCGFTSCAVIPGFGVFVADCLACIGAAIPFFGPIPENVCS